MIRLAIRSNPDHLPAPCAHKRLHALLSNIKFFPEQSTRLVRDEGISFSGRIVADVWQSGVTALAESLEVL